MGERKGRILGLGCLFLLIGIIVGALIVAVVLLVWPATHAAKIAPPDSGKLPSGYDVEVRVSEAFMNQAAADELAKSQGGSLGQIALDLKPGSILIATVEGAFDFGGWLGGELTIQSTVLLEVHDGALAARMQQIELGPLTINREDLPDFLLSTLASMEESMVAPIQNRFKTEGMELVGVGSDETTLILGLAPIAGTQ